MRVIEPKQGWQRLSALGNEGAVASIPVARCSPPSSGRAAPTR